VEKGENLSALLFPQTQNELLDEAPGLVVLGLQEMVELSTTNVIGR
jgi:hypothetical protein